MATFEIFRDDRNEYRWRLRAGNGAPMAQSEGYTTKADALEAIELIRRDAAQAAVKDETISTGSIRQALESWTDTGKR